MADLILSPPETGYLWLWLRIKRQENIYGRQRCGIDNLSSISLVNQALSLVFYALVEQKRDTYTNTDPFISSTRSFLGNCILMNMYN